MLKYKSEVDGRVRDFFEFVERQTGAKVKYISSDNGGEYGSNTLKYYLDRIGIVFEKTESYKMRNNGVAERTNSILIDKARSMMQCLDVPQKFWAKALSTAINLRNVIPSALIDSKKLRDK